MSKHRQPFDWLKYNEEHTASFPGCCITEVADNRRIVIENHKGVIQYGCTEICVNTGFGQTIIRGCDMELSQMSKERLVITGRIDEVILKGSYEK